MNDCGIRGAYDYAYEVLLRFSPKMMPLMIRQPIIKINNGNRATMPNKGQTMIN